MRGKRLWMIVPFVAALVLYPLAAASQLRGARGSSTGAPITDDFPEDTCGSSSQCHTNSEGGPGRVVIEAPATYTPGAPLEFTIRVEEAERAIFGFQVAVKAFDAQQSPPYDHIGTLEVVDPVTTKFVVAPLYVTHTENGITQNEWRVRWIPPADEGRPVTIYAAGNAADGDETREGDHIYTTNWRMTSATTTAVEEAPGQPVFTLERAYPNPFTTSTTIRYTLRAPAPVVISLYDALGRRLQVLNQGRQGTGPHQARLDANGLPAGLYLYEVRTPEARASRPLLLMK